MQQKEFAVCDLWQQTAGRLDRKWGWQMALLFAALRRRTTCPMWRADEGKVGRGLGSRWLLSDGSPAEEIAQALNNNMHVFWTLPKYFFEQVFIFFTLTKPTSYTAPVMLRTCS